MLLVKRNLFIALFVFAGCNESGKQLKSLEAKKIEPLHPTISVVVDDYCTQGTTRVNFILHNPHVKLTSYGVMLDQDGDGVIDVTEQTLGARLDIDPSQYDTNGDQYPDLIIKLGGYTVDEQKKFVNCTMSADKDGDGLADCVEGLIGTNEDSFDTDRDGIPDLLELYLGTSPLIEDGYLDSDKDGVTNLEELKLGTPIKESNSIENIAKYAMKYDLKEKSDNLVRQCYTYTVNNIPVNPAIEENIIYFYFIENNGTKDILKRYPLVVPAAGATPGTVIRVPFADLAGGTP